METFIHKKSLEAVKFLLLFACKKEVEKFSPPFCYFLKNMIENSLHENKINGKILSKKERKISHEKYKKNIFYYCYDISIYFN